MLSLDEGPDEVLDASNPNEFMTQYQNHATRVTEHFIFDSPKTTAKSDESTKTHSPLESSIISPKDAVLSESDLHVSPSITSCHQRRLSDASINVSHSATNGSCSSVGGDENLSSTKSVVGNVSGDISADFAESRSQNPTNSSLPDGSHIVNDAEANECDLTESYNGDEYVVDEDFCEGNSKLSSIIYFLYRYFQVLFESLFFRKQNFCFIQITELIFQHFYAFSKVLWVCTCCAKNYVLSSEFCLEFKNFLKTGRFYI